MIAKDKNCASYLMTSYIKMEFEYEMDFALENEFYDGRFIDAAIFSLLKRNFKR